MPPKPICPELLELRRQNVLSLFVRWRLQQIAQGHSGEDRAFATLLGISNAQWSRAKAGTPIGGKLARQFEQACGVEAGWLDQAHASGAEVSGLPTLPEMPGSEPASSQALARALGLPVALLETGLGLAQSPTRAGFPSPAADHRVVRVDLNAELIQNEQATMLVRVRGDSMRDAGILDGSLLVVDKALSPVHGDIVVAVVDDEFTVKQLHHKDGQIKLLPANPAYPEIVPVEGQELRIWGVVTSTIKRFR